jgi:hypothetical protein
MILSASCAYIGDAARWHSSLLGEWPTREFREASTMDSKAHVSDVYGSLSTFARLLLATTPNNALSYLAHGQTKMRHHPSPSMASPGKTSPNRRAILAAIPPILAFPGIAAAKDAPTRAAGTYYDPRNPDGLITVSPQGNGLVVSGRDFVGSKEWKLEGKFQGDSDNLIFDFSPKNGPAEVGAIFNGEAESLEEERPACLDFKSDGSQWFRLSKQGLITAANYAGTFSVSDGDKKLKRKILITGYTARVQGIDEIGGDEWEVPGRYQPGGCLIVDFSSRGGAKDVDIKKTSKGLELSNGQLWT